MSLIIRGLVGLLALLAGRQAFWTFVGAAGFLLGFNVAGRLLGDLPPWLLLLIGLGAGLLGALLAVVAQRLAVALAGFVAGGYLLLYVGDLLRLGGSELLEGLLFVAGGLVGAILISVLFDPALIVLSAALGAMMLTEVIVSALNWEPVTAALLFVSVCFFVVGILVQRLAWQPGRQPGRNAR